MSWTWNKIAPKPEALAALDPYLEWAMQTGFRYYFGSGGAGLIPILMELEISAQAFVEKKWPKGWQDWLSIPPLYAYPPAGLAPARYCTANVKAEFFKQLASAESPLRAVIKRVALSLPLKAHPARAFVTQAPRLRGKPKPGVAVTGIIDDGLAFAHVRLRNGLQTRIQYLWNQDGPASGAPPYGFELLKADIDTAMTSARYLGMVDEDQVYRATAHLDFTRSGHKSVAHRGTHGAHVMDVACGFDASATRLDRPIVAVQLPLATTWDSSGALLAVPVLDGLRYIVDRADRIAAEEKCGPLPIAVNLSYGTMAGPHDGKSLLESAMDELVRLRKTVAPMALVLPAGNSYLNRCHAQFDLRQAPRILQWRVQPDDRTPSFMEIWLPELERKRSRVQLRITTPTGVTSPPISEGEVWEWIGINEVLCKAIYFDGVARGRKRNMILIVLAPSATLDAAAEVAPAGTWDIEFTNLGPEATIDAWIQRDDTPYGYPRRGRQSRFDDPSYEYWTSQGREQQVDDPASYVKRAATLNAIATGQQPIVVAGMRRKDWRTAKYSAAGPIITAPATAPHRAGPDATTICDDAVAYHGTLAGGTRSGSTVALNGTSVAAPQVTRWAVDQMAAGAAIDRTSMPAFPSVPPAAVPPMAPAPLPPMPPPQRAGVRRGDNPATAPGASRRRYEA